MTAPGGTLGPREILGTLPHRFPMLLLDRVEELVPGSRGIGIKNVAHNEPCFQGHFPEAPVLPGVLLIECMAQLAAVILATPAADAPRAEGRPGTHWLAGVRKVDFHQPVVPGDTLVVELSVVRRLGSLAIVSAVATVRGTKVATGELTVARGEP